MLDSPSLFIDHLLRIALGVSQEVAFNQGSCRNTSTLYSPPGRLVERFLSGDELVQRLNIGMSSESHMSRNLQRMIDHLIHVAASSGPHKRTLLDLATTRDYEGR